MMMMMMMMMMMDDDDDDVDAYAYAYTYLYSCCIMYMCICIRIFICINRIKTLWAQLIISEATLSLPVQHPSSSILVHPRPSSSILVYNHYRRLVHHHWNKLIPAAHWGADKIFHFLDARPNHGCLHGQLSPYLWSETLLIKTEACDYLPIVRFCSFFSILSLPPMRSKIKRGAARPEHRILLHCCKI